MGVGFGYLLALVHIQGQFEFHGVSQGSACDHIGRVCGVAQPGDPRCTSGVAQYGELRIYNRVGTESQLDDIQ